jgi:Holliday junction resolvase RusA-like endonuclease
MSAAQTQQRLVITMPHPPASLSPNGRPNRWERAADTKRTRRDAMLVTRQSMWDQLAEWDINDPWPSARMDICWLFAGVEPDSDNIVARLKAVRDGIADALLVTDDKHIQIGTVTTERVPRKEQGVVLTLVREEPRPPYRMADYSPAELDELQARDAAILQAREDVTT